MNAKQRNQRTAATHDTSDQQLENDAVAEQKVIYVWKSMREIFGLRWTDHYGIDPSGKDNAVDRKQIWIDEIKYVSFPSLRAALQRLTHYQKPYEGWLPDLVSFMAFVGKRSSIAPQTRPEDVRHGTWVDKVCSEYLIRYVMNLQHSPTVESAKILFQTMRRVADGYNMILQEEERDEVVSAKRTNATNVVKMLLKQLGDVTLVKADAAEMESQRRKLRLGVKPPRTVAALS